MGRIAQLVLLLSIAVLPCTAAHADDPSLALKEGRADNAIHLLRAQLALDPRDANAHQLLCRVFYAEDAFNSAIHECEAAVAIAPGDSRNHLWLGRAYGMKASQVNPISAFSLARKVVAAFEKAVALDPTNVAAMRDLGEYYVNAPGIVGGGLDKARALAAKMMPVSPTKAHRLLAQVAEKSGDYATAETEFKRAVDAQRSAQSYIDLAQFYLGRKQFDQIDALIQSAMRLDHPRDASAVDAASVLIASGRSIPLAEQLLREYLASPTKSDGAPAFKVHVQLGDLLLDQADQAGALRQYDAALTLAADYAPAKRSRDQASRQSVSKVSGANAIP
jgi:tetratricopeptide (TPR) repeat protein